MHLYQKGEFGLCLILYTTYIVFVILAAGSIYTQCKTLNFSSENPFKMVNGNISRVKDGRIVKLSEALANRKTQIHLLETQFKSDIFSSIRPKIGKKFHYDHLELLKQQTLETSRVELLKIGLEEGKLDLVKTQDEFRQFFLSLQSDPNVTARTYLDLTNMAFNLERKFIKKCSEKHQRKLQNFNKKNGIDQTETSNLNYSLEQPKPQKRIRHKALMKIAIKRREKGKKKRTKDKKLDDIQAKIQEIKANNQVINLSSVEVPDDVFLYLALGSTFVPHMKPSDHDLVYDTKLFCRNLAWRAYFHANPTDKDGDRASANEDGLDLAKNIESLRPPGTTWPQYSSKLLEEVNSKLMQGVSNITKTAKEHKTNLTHRESKGLKWCLKNTKDRKVYITRADKGGAILILDSSDVDSVILENLTNPSKFTVLAEDPRAKIRTSLIDLLRKAAEDKVIPPKVLHYITGVIEHEDKNTGYSHSHVFQIAIPYLYPLFKLHKLSREAILDKTIPPTRMVTGSTNGPTYRLSLFIDSVLQPIALQYCAPELIKDTTTFIQYVENNKAMLESDARYVCNLDVAALYPSIPKDKALLAIDHALETVGVVNTQKEFITNIVHFSINNSVLQYRGTWYSSDSGIPTGGPDSGSIANIFVKWLLISYLLPSVEVAKHNFSLCRKRFLDDIFMPWRGTPRQFDMFLTALNKTGEPFGIQFTGACAKAIEFLDVLVDMSSGKLKTKLYVKPTDSPTYLHRRSYHNNHVFKSLPNSQFRRAVIICSEEEDRLNAINYMHQKFLKCGYSSDELDFAKAKALFLNRNNILGVVSTPLTPAPVDIPEAPHHNPSIVFVSTYSSFTAPLKGLVKDLKNDIKVLIGHDNIIFANKKNPNTASLLFCKSSFSQKPKIVGENQKCNARNCRTCPIMTLPKEVLYNELKIKLDFSLDCKSDNIIYLARCKHHSSSETELRLICIDDNQCYFGQTCNACHLRLNGHRNCFKTENNAFEKSALSMHIYSDHVANFTEKLLNYELGIIKQVKPCMLVYRTEDFFIWKTRADIIGLNRHKVRK